MFPLLFWSLSFFERATRKRASRPTPPPEGLFDQAPVVRPGKVELIHLSVSDPHDLRHVVGGARLSGDEARAESQRQHEIALGTISMWNRLDEV